MGIEFGRLYVLQVACKHNHIRLLGIDTVDGSLQHPTVMLHVTAHMGIGELYDAITVEGFGQVFGNVFDVIDFQLVETHKCTPVEYEPNEGNAQDTYEIAVIPGRMPL